jgi:hypothetical protein
MIAATVGLMKLLGEVGVELDQEQTDALDVKLTALIEEAQAATMFLANCPVCGCSLATFPKGGCVHACSCCGLGGGGRR